MAVVAGVSCGWFSESLIWCLEHEGVGYRTPCVRKTTDGVEESRKSATDVTGLRKDSCVYLEVVPNVVSKE